jgi:hypothetical protein
LPDKPITFDEAVATTAEPAAARITFDEAMTPLQSANAALDVTGRQAAGNDVRPGEELVKGSFDRQGNFTPPTAYQRPLPADASRFGTALKSNIPEDPGTRLKVIADSIFPGDPKGIEKVGIRNGRPVYVNDQGQLQYVSGPLSQLGAGVAASAPEIAGSIAGGLISGPGAPIVGPAVGGASGRAAKRAASALLLDEPVTPTGFATEVALEGAVNAAGAGLGKFVGGTLNRGRFINPGALDGQALRNAEQVIAQVKRDTGIELDLAQATGNRYLLELRDYAAKFPGKTADIFQLRDDVAAGNFEGATKRVLDLVAQPQPRTITSTRAVNAAKGVLTAAQKDVSQQVRPLYDAAYASVPQITDPQLLNFLKLPYFEDAFKSGQRIAKLEGSALTGGQAPDLRSFDYLKQGLDDVIESLERNGSSKEARALRERKNDFVGQLDTLSGDLYKKARAAYGQAYQRQVSPLEDGLVGVLAKIKPDKVSTAARIFNDPSLPPEQIALLKYSLSRSDPDAYNGLVRQYLAREYNTAQRTTQGSDTVNPAGKLYQRLFGSPDAKAKLKALLPAGAIDDAQKLFEAAEKLAKTPLGASRISGSSTETRGQIADALANRLGPVRDLFTTTRETVRETGRQQSLEKGVQMIADALTDPGKRKLLRNAVRIKDSTRQAIVLSGILGAQTAGGALKDITENAGPGYDPGLLQNPPRYRNY